MGVFIHDKLIPFFPEKSTWFRQMMSLCGEVVRHKEGRRTQRIQLGDESYFIKQFFGVGWKEIFKNIMSLRLPVLDARPEWMALQRLQQLGIDVPSVFAFGHRFGFNLAKRQSFILTKDLNTTISLEDFAYLWKNHPSFLELKKAIINKVAYIAKTLHENKMNHRDFYMCHFLLDISNGIEKLEPKQIKIYLIDLHRAQVKHRRQRRWIIKDLAGLYFSSKNRWISKHDLFNFLKAYRGLPLRKILRYEKDFWEAVISRGEALYRKHYS